MKRRALGTQGGEVLDRAVAVAEGREAPPALPGGLLGPPSPRPDTQVPQELPQAVLPRRGAHWRYLGYLLRHRWFVLIECWHLGILPRGLVHDWSKFLPSEWFPYAARFFGARARGSFDRAWLHHLQRNDHHWDHWVLWRQGKPIPLLMPEQAIREMVADWRAMGREKGEPEAVILCPVVGTVRRVIDVRPWYEKHRETILLHPISRDRVEHLLRYS